MGQVAVVIKIFPDDVANFGSMKENVIKELNPKNIKIEELAFGLKALKIMVIMDDKQGAGNVEEKIMQIKGVGQAQVEDMTLV
jgi:elongation factor 1-beta